ncbi:hypothetical protein K9U33_04570 [Rhodoblastus acidophilus]|uniref:Uncharacterized protein n=1 Tax=Candidatus Rhodoblastus alkanivorans TaxID=2954117 RepID=A0ABS9Z879_9HYPH|nr:hypothetical protein [Candidatus Rhodoblastus alkanivorans]MCI4677929.1 hypothetical protein [Candidatus Rhodoblastus alkanivorans]MCI4683824.1 hypothetical protein [Candidatus Rhodoblastus alkanivorans]
MLVDGDDPFQGGVDDRHQPRIPFPFKVAAHSIGERIAQKPDHIGDEGASDQEEDWSRYRFVERIDPQFDDKDREQRGQRAPKQSALAERERDGRKKSYEGVFALASEKGDPQ